MKWLRRQVDLSSEVHISIRRQPLRQSRAVCYKINTTGLTSGKTYYFFVRAYIDEGKLWRSSELSPTLSVTPQNLTPTGLAVTSTGYNSLKLSWNAKPTVTGYQIQRAPFGTSSWVTIASNHTSTTYEDTGLACGSQYQYQVRSTNPVATSAWSSSVTGKPIPSVPGRPRAYSFNYDTLRLDWDPVDGASGYRIERSSSLPFSWVSLGTTTDDSFMSGGLTCGSTVYYRVRAYRVVSKSIVVDGNWTEVFSGTPEPRIVFDLKASSGGFDSVDLSWSAVDGASGYAIQRSMSSSGPWTTVTTSVASTSHTDSGLVCGTGYYYQVRAYRTVNKTRVYGDWVTSNAATPIPDRPSYFHLSRAGSQKIRVEWSAVAGANGYSLERGLSYTGPWTVINVNGLEYLDTGLTNGKPYYYRVRAYRLRDKTIRVYGPYTPSLSLTPNASPTPSPSPSPTPGMPSISPGMTPSPTPGATPAISPGMTPSVSPGLTPALSPGVSPSLSPGAEPSLSPGAETDGSTSGGTKTTSQEGDEGDTTDLTAQDQPLSSETGSQDTSSDSTGSDASGTTQNQEDPDSGFPWAVALPVAAVALGGIGVLLYFLTKGKKP